MSAAESLTPRVFLARHGETSWAKSGRYTGISDIPLTSHGEAQVAATAKILVGTGKLIDVAKLERIFVSPRIRAQATFELLFNEETRERLKGEGKVETTNGLAEQDYGIYEGLKEPEIRAGRKERGLDRERPWNIWQDACEGGETTEAMTARLDALIGEIHALQSPNMRGEKPCDVVLVAHGHILQAFVKRWLKYPMEFPLSLMLEPGGVGIVSYQNHDINKPAMFIGMAFPLAQAE